jgi:hypothetical protein
MASVFENFVAAVRARKHLVCDYQGFRRECCVHVVGWKCDQERALVFQFGGGSSTGLRPGGDWRCLRLSEVSGVSLRDGPWHSGDGDMASQTCVDDIAAEVED